jgi:preprotein translocase subunit YajC
MNLELFRSMGMFDFQSIFCLEMYQIIYIFYFLLYKCTSKQTENIKKIIRKKN